MTEIFNITASPKGVKGGIRVGWPKITMSKCFIMDNGPTFMDFYANLMQT